MTFSLQINYICLCISATWGLVRHINVSGFLLEIQRLKFGLPLGFIQEYYKNLSKAVTQTIYTASTTLAHFDIQSISSHLSLTMHREDGSTRTTEYTCFSLWVVPFQRIICIFTSWGRQLCICVLSPQTLWLPGIGLGPPRLPSTLPAKPQQ